jgi:hypothetical protein
MVTLDELRERMVHRFDELRSADSSDDELRNCEIAAFCDVLFDCLIADTTDPDERRVLDSARRRFYMRMLHLARTGPRTVRWMTVLTEAICDVHPSVDTFPIRRRRSGRSPV